MEVAFLDKRTSPSTNKKAENLWKKRLVEPASHTAAGPYPIAIGKEIKWAFKAGLKWEKTAKY